MYRTVSIAVIALAAITLPAATSLALGLGSGAGTFAAPMASVAPAVSPVAAMGGGVTAGPPPKRGGGPPAPRAKKLSPEGGAACFPARTPAVSPADHAPSSPHSSPRL